MLAGCLIKKSGSGGKLKMRTAFVLLLSEINYPSSGDKADVIVNCICVDLENKAVNNSDWGALIHSLGF